MRLSLASLPPHLQNALQSSVNLNSLPKNENADRFVYGRIVSYYQKKKIVNVSLSPFEIAKNEEKEEDLEKEKEREKMERESGRVEKFVIASTAHDVYPLTQELKYVRGKPFFPLFIDLFPLLSLLSLSRDLLHSLDSFPLFLSAFFPQIGIYFGRKHFG